MKTTDSLAVAAILVLLGAITYIASFIIRGGSGPTDSDRLLVTIASVPALLYIFWYLSNAKTSAENVPLERFARKYGMQSHIGNPPMLVLFNDIKYPYISGIFRGRALEMGYFLRLGKGVMTFFFVNASVKCGPFALRIEPRAKITILGSEAPPEIAGQAVQGITAGEPFFDRTYIISTNNPSRAERLLRGKTLHNISVLLSTHTAQYIQIRAGELRFKRFELVPRGLSAPSDLEEIAETVCAVAEAVETA